MHTGRKKKRERAAASERGCPRGLYPVGSSDMPTEGCQIGSFRGEHSLLQKLSIWVGLSQSIIQHLTVMFCVVTNGTICRRFGVGESKIAYGVDENSLSNVRKCQQCQHCLRNSRSEFDSCQTGMIL